MTKLTFPEDFYCGVEVGQLDDVFGATDSVAYTRYSSRPLKMKTIIVLIDVYREQKEDYVQYSVGISSQVFASMQMYDFYITGAITLDELDEAIVMAMDYYEHKYDGRIERAMNKPMKTSDVTISQRQTAN